MRLLSLTLCVLFSTQAFAKTEIARTNAFVYYKTPMSEMLDSERKLVVQRSLDMLVKAIRASHQSNGINPKDVSQQLRAIELANVEIDSIANAALEYANSIEFNGLGLSALAPSAVVLAFGKPIALGGKTGKASVSVGAIAMPVRIERVDLLTGEVETYHRLEYSFIGFGSGNVAGTSTPATIRGGIGFVWGPLEKAEDFQGLALGLSGDSGFKGMGFNLKAGVLKQWGKAMFMNERVNPFVLVSWQGFNKGKFTPVTAPVVDPAAPVVAPTLRGNVTPIINLSSPLKSMVENALGTEFNEELQVQDLRIETKDKEKLIEALNP